MPENETIRVGFEEGVTESICVTPLGSSIYRLEQTPVWNPDPVVYLGDAIELELLPDGTHRFVRVVERAALRHYDWVVPQFFVESREYAQFGKAVEAAGGAWEGIMGGGFLCISPKPVPLMSRGNSSTGSQSRTQSYRRGGGRSGNADGRGNRRPNSSRCRSRRRRTSGCTGRGANIGASVIQCRCAAPVNLVVGV
jgi:hypothetical protein